MNAKPRRLSRAIAALLGLAATHAGAASFVYEGRLDDRGAPASGRYDIRLTPYPDAMLGSTLAPPMVFEGVEVRDGRFRLDFDLPLGREDGTWLELGVRDAGAAHDFAAIPGRAKAVAAPLVGACWSTTGDSGINPASNFIGSTDNQPLVVRSNNLERGRFDGGGLRVNGPTFESLVELSVRAAPAQDYANILLEPNTTAAPRSGILASAGDGVAGSNNQGFYLDHYQAPTDPKDPPAQLRRLAMLPNGSTVFSDRASGAFASSGPNQFLVRATGGVGINTSHYLDQGFITMHLAAQPNFSRANLWISGRNTNNGALTNSGVLLQAGGTGGAADSPFYVTAFATVPASPFEIERRMLALESNGSGTFAGTNNNTTTFPAANAVALGGSGNSTLGENAVALGGSFNAASGANSVAAGSGASVRAQDPGSFVFADQSRPAPFPTIAPNSFSVRSLGGARIVTNADNFGTPTNGVRIGFNEGAWSSLSDRAVKSAIESVDVGRILRRVLDLPVSEWSYRGSEAAVRHIGPMAQDFHAAFGLGDSERHISTIDADGVAIAAIQGLNAKLEAENAALRADLEALRAEVRALAAASTR